MELIDEKQRFPFVFSCAMAALIILGSFVVTHFVDPVPSSENRFYWYMARAAGFTSYGLLSVAVLLGVSSSSGLWDKWRVRKFITQMHQYAALLVLPFLFFHLWGLHLDNSVPFPWVSIGVPFLAHYRPIPTAFGILTVYGWLLLIVTSHIREKIGVKVWRTVHYAAFPTFVMVTLHGLLTGTDSRNLWAIVIYVIPTVLFFVLVAKRLRK